MTLVVFSELKVNFTVIQLTPCSHLIGTEPKNPNRDIIENVSIRGLIQKGLALIHVCNSLYYLLLNNAFLVFGPTIPSATNPFEV